jgi:hypothetical protein
LLGCRAERRIQSAENPLSVGFAGVA